MRIAIIHHHLHPGGVTRVIESQINAMLNFIERDELSVFTGDAQWPEYLNGIEKIVHVEKSVQYLPKGISDEKMLEIFQEIMLCLGKIASAHDILHLHNLNLGKNPLLTMAIFRLASHGIKIINHCHDFAEDRPENYAFLGSVIGNLFKENLPEVLYPPFQNYHYIVLTSKDYERLTGYGISPDRISLLPNPVDFRIRKGKKNTQDAIKRRFGIDRRKKICLYPVRAIHRKNIGEFILLSVLFRQQASWLITQPPRNPLEIPEYERWKKFCIALQIPVIFEAGEVIDFHELLPAVDLCITTSVMEGFGLAFMEPWLAGISVIGRNIEYCTVDLKRNGMQFPLLYNRFIVTFNGEKKDFKELDQKQQQQVITDVLLEPDKGREMVAANPFLTDFLNPVKKDIIQNNQQVIRERYSLENYGQQLHGIYKKILDGA